MQSLDIDQGDAVQLLHRVVDIAWQRQIHQCRRARNVFSRERETVARRGGDSDIHTRQRARPRREIDHLCGHACLARMLGEALRARACAVSQDEPAHATLTQVRRRERRHRACAEHERRFPLEGVRAHRLHRLIEREGHHGRPGIVDRRLGVDALAGVQRRLRQRMKRRADRAALRRILVGGAHLPDDLLLSHHHGVQAGSDPHEVLGGGIGIADVQVPAQLSDIHAGEALQHAQHVVHARVEGIRDRVHLEPVARGDDHRLRQARLLRENLAGLVLHGVVHAQPLQQRNGRRAMGHAHHENTHENFLQTSSLGHPAQRHRATSQPKDYPRHPTRSQTPSRSGVTRDVPPAPRQARHYPLPSRRIPRRR